MRDVTEQIMTAITSGGATGICVALAVDGVIAWEQGFGWADFSRQLPAKARTPFCLASLTKPFTTAALMTLVADGRFTLDTPINRALGIRQSEPNAFPDAATIRLLGAHGAGLPSLFEMLPFDTASAPRSFSAFVERFGTPAYPPGALYEYSNIGYALLGEIAARALGQPFHTVLHERVLAPLGLKDCLFGDAVRTAVNTAARYDERGAAIPYYSTSTPASGELYASAHDVARFGSRMMQRGVRQRRVWLADEQLDELFRPVLSGDTGGSSTFGWFRGSTQNGQVVLCKDGGQPGVSTICYLLPSERACCVVLANRTDNGGLVQSIADRVMRTLVSNWTAPETLVTTSRQPLQAGSHFAGDWRGTFRDSKGHQPLSLAVSGQDRATLTLGSDSPLELAEVGVRASALVGTIAPSRHGKADAVAQTSSLGLKLVATGDELTGRLLETTQSAAQLSVIPSIVKLRRLDSQSKT